jgi:hypothetical protein
MLPSWNILLWNWVHHFETRCILTCFSDRFPIVSIYLTHATDTRSVLKPKVLVANRHWRLRSVLKTESENKQRDLTSSYVRHEKTHFIPESHTLYIPSRNVPTWSNVKWTSDKQIVATMIGHAWYRPRNSHPDCNAITKTPLCENTWQLDFMIISSWFRVM